MNTDGYAQNDSTQKNILVLKKINNTQAFIIKEEKNVTLYLRDNITVKGEPFRVGDTFVIVNNQKIGFKQISKIKYRDGWIDDVKFYSKILTIETVWVALCGLIIMNAAPGELPSDMMDMSDLQFLGYAMFALGLYHTIEIVPFIFIPYRRFNLSTKWQIIPGIK